eukprot:1346453-Amorphochlora_amoeboformis.AAC.1
MITFIFIVLGNVRSGGNLLELLEAINHGMLGREDKEKEKEKEKERGGEAERSEKREIRERRKKGERETSTITHAMTNIPP